MQHEPIYIPRKFRKDNFNTRSKNEKDSVTKFELQRFRSECEIINIRKNNVTENIFDIDKDIDIFIENSNTSPGCKKMLKERWETVINEDIKRIKNKLERKKESTRSAFERDRNIVSPKYSFREFANRKVEENIDEENNNADEVIDEGTEISSDHVISNSANKISSKNRIATQYERPFLRSSTSQNTS